MATVLYLQTDHSEINMRSLDGALVFARNSGVRFQLVECWRKMDKNNSSAFPKEDFERLVKFWKASAVIVDCGRPGLDLAAFSSKQVPVVYLDCRRFKPKGGVFISNDDIAVSDAAFTELLHRPLNSLAYVGFPGNTVWSRNRSKRFAETAELNGYTAYVYDDPCPNDSNDSGLEEWLMKLPKPGGIFAANDYIARHVISCCHRRGILLPDEVSVVGVDNEHTICETSETTISSVQCDFFAAGKLAAEMACRLVRSSKSHCPDAVFGVLCVVRRQSTRVFVRRDERVIKAVDFIRANALRKISVSDVVKVMDCSRRLAELRFREVLGRSIFDEIRDVRISAAIDFLCRQRVSVAEAATSCGYKTPSALRKAFHSVNGESLATWKKRFSKKTKKEIQQ